MVRPFIFKTPERRQVDPIECGAVCLGIVLEAYGHWVSNRELRKACNTSRNGSDAASIITAAKKFSLKASSKKYLASEIKRSMAPSILFFDQSHFVVFEGHFLGKYFINDPACGRIQLSFQEFHRRFSNFLIFLRKEEDFFSLGSKNKANWSSVDIASKISFMSLGIFSGLVFSVFAAFLGLFFGKAFGIKLDMVEFNAGITVLLGVIIFGLWILWLNIRNSWVKLIRSEVEFIIGRLPTLPFGFFDDIPFFVVSRHIKRIIKDSLAITLQGVSRYFLMSFFGTLLLVAGITAPIFAFVILITLLAHVPAVIRPASRNNLRFRDTANALNVALFPMWDMRAMGQTQFALDGLMGNELARIDLPAVNFWNGFTAISVLLFFFSGAWAWQLGNLTIREVFALLILFSFMLMAIRVLVKSAGISNSEHSIALRRELESRESHVRLLDPVDDNDALIVLKSLTFSYPKETSLLRNVELVITKHEVLGVVGAESSGVSTFLRILGGKLEPTSGQLIHYTKNQTGLSIASIDSDADLMQASLKDNVTLFNPRISEHAVFSALKEAFALDLFFNRPLGLLTEINAHGHNLSNGEKKRLILATAFAHCADIFLLDDFFLDLDKETAEKILNNFKTRSKTVVFNTFRESELNYTSRVIFLNKGGIAVDHHEILMRKYPEYRDLIILEEPGKEKRHGG